jgi:glycosyltransferase involved in cell wall biosynthesis
MPGAGGGSLRTHEINRRLAQRGHEITVLTTRYPGCVDRVQDGVRYEHIGLGTGRNRLTRLLGYISGLPVAARGHDADLVIEDFFAPFSTMAAPLWTGRPTIGVVQWLHAKSKSSQYRLPFYLLETAGVRAHHRLITVSQGTGDQLLDMNPQLRVDVIGNGVDSRAFGPAQQIGNNIVYIGRLELVGKGLDLLLEAWSRIHSRLAGNLLIAGTGPDETKVRRLVDRLGITGSVQFVGWVSGGDKFQLLNQARVVVVPSRQETFGLVALEALAAATPVVIFDIPCLREVVPDDCGWKVPAFDIDSLADRLTALYHNDDALLSAGRAGRKFASAYGWDALAARQAAVYSATLREYGQ